MNFDYAKAFVDKPEVEWIACDKDGEWFGYSDDEPKKGHDVFYHDFGRYMFIHHEHKENPNWRDSLRKRPETVGEWLAVSCEIDMSVAKKVAFEMSNGNCPHVSIQY